MRTLAFVATIGLAVLTIAACSKDPTPVHDKPADEAALPPPIATAGPSSRLPSDIPDLINDSPKPPGAVQETDTPTPSPVSGQDEQGLETIVSDPIPHADFPDHIALIYRVAPNIRLHWEGVGPEIPLLRVYKRNGVVTREVLFSLDQPGPQVIPPPKSDKNEQDPEYSLRRQVDMTMTPDLARIVVAICHWADCAQASMGAIYYHEDPPSPHVTDLYESIDGGVTWHHLDTLPGPWLTRLVSAGSAEREPQLLLFRFQSSPRYLLYPSGDTAQTTEQSGRLEEGVLSDRRPLPDYEELEVNQNREYEPNFIPELWLSDNEILGRQRYPVASLFGGAALGLAHHASYLGIEIEGEIDWYNLWPWPTIHNVETGDLHPVALPPRALRIGDWPYLLAVQHGPFLRVIDTGGDCIQLKANPTADAEELDCVAERVLLQDQGRDAIADDGVTWRKVKTPAGIVGWANGRFLE